MLRNGKHYLGAHAQLAFSPNFTTVKTDNRFDYCQANTASPLASIKKAGIPLLEDPGLRAENKRIIGLY
jgi:hypothetical protein